MSSLRDATSPVVMSVDQDLTNMARECLDGSVFDQIDLLAEDVDSVIWEHISFVIKQAVQDDMRGLPTIFRQWGRGWNI